VEIRGSVLQWPADRPQLTRLIFFLLGVLFTGTFAPFNLAILTPLILTPVLYVCLTVAPRDAVLCMFWFGFGLFLSGTYWVITSIVGFGGAPLPLGLVLMLGLVLIMTLWVMLCGWLINALSHGEPLRLLWVAPASWVLIEWLRGFVLTGFPWMAIGYSQVGMPMAGFAPVFGIYGVSFFMVFSVAAIVLAAMSRGPLRGIGIALSLSPWLIGGVLNTVTWTEPSGDPIKTTILQVGVGQEQKWADGQLDASIRFYLAGTRAAKDSELVVWPEVAIPARGYASDQAAMADLVRTLRADTLRSGAAVALGVFQYVPERGEILLHNSVALLSGNAPVQFYQKRHLVPFGEYFPVPGFVREWMAGVSLDFADISPGRDEQPLLELPSGVRVSTAICYEDAYGAEQRYAFPEAGLIINVSNDGWFGSSIAPDQHLQIARMRSLETGRPTIRSTNNGISAFIDADGDIVEQGPQFQPVSMTRSVQPRQGTTPYIDWGNWPVIALSGLLLTLFWSRSRGLF